MWKKNEEDQPMPSPEPVIRAPRPQPPQARGGMATLGPSLVLKGELTGDEDLVILGRLDGKVELKKNSVTVGSSGKVKADIYGSSIQVEGEVHGNLYGEKEVVIRETGTVLGNIIAPRVSLENGSKFKGSIDMEPGTTRVAEPRPQASTAAAKSAGPTPASRNEPEKASGLKATTPPSTP